MPPAREPDRMANARDAEPFRDGHRIVFRRPYPVFRDLFLEAEPVGARRAVSPPIETWMIRENLDPCSDDEHHEEEIEEVQKAQPERKAGMDRAGRGSAARVAGNECLHPRHGSQLLRDGDSEDQQNQDKREDPQNIDPSSSYSNAWNDALLGRQPSTQPETIVGCAQARLDTVVQGLSTNVRHVVLSPQALACFRTAPRCIAMCSVLELLISYCGSSSLAR